MNGNVLSTEMNLGSIVPEAKGFTLRDRADFSGHGSGRVDPHVNSEVLGPGGNKVIRDLSSNQLSGMNGMQNG